MKQLWVGRGAKGEDFVLEGGKGQIPAGLQMLLGKRG